MVSEKGVRTGIPQTLFILPEDRVAISLTRIFGSLFVNLDKIDTAVADSIR